MASLYPPGIENPRRTHENAIKRMERLVHSDRFKKMGKHDLETHLAMFDKSFENFTAEHEKLIVKLREPAQFSLEDNFYTTIQELYRSSVIAFRKQMDKVEREKLLRSMACRAKDGAKVRTNEPQIKQQQQVRTIDSETEKQQQQQQYENEVRQLREVQRKDAVILAHRTQEWVNQHSKLNKSTELDDLEKQRQQLNAQLDELDKQQGDLRERTQRFERESNIRGRSRSPVTSADIRRSNEMHKQHRLPLPNAGKYVFRRTNTNDMRHRSSNRPPIEVFGNVNSVAVPTQDLRNRIERIQNRQCHFCGENHKMFQCKRFLDLKRSEREQHVTVLKLCKNCFMPLEDGRHRCRFGRCDNCGIGQFHNSLLCPVRHPE